MRTSIRIFLVILVTAAVGFSMLYRWISEDLKPQFRASTEEPLVDTAWLLAGLASAQLQDGRIDPAPFRRALADVGGTIPPSPIYGFTKTSMDLRIYMTDASGRVVFDSSGRDEGADYSRWNDVYLTLQGRYGTRTSSDPSTDSALSTMYVAAPIRYGEKIVGVVSVGKPTGSVNAFIEASRQKLLAGGLVTLAAVLVATLLLSLMVTRPITRLTAYARSVSRGERQPMPKLGGGEAGMLGRAFAEMLTALEGKQYVENYIQTLTHEMKSPIASIQGAVELLHEDMPEDRRGQFLGNIEKEARRMHRLIERLLLLASIENRKALQHREKVDLLRLANITADSLATIASTRGVEIAVGGSPATIDCEPFLVEQAIANILQNALEFSGRNALITATVSRSGDTARLTVEDSGPGIPDYALPRIFDRFYSLKRPDSGRKSSGLGLSLVREAMLLHGGTVAVENLPAGGTRATLAFPM
jgi:two-component system sensor histidine kinase CreC